MREVKALGSSMKLMMDRVKREAAAAQSSFESEANRALVNSDKVQSVAADLKEANAEIETFLGEAGSNFPPSETSSPATPPVIPHTGVEYEGKTLVLKDP